MIVVPMVCVAIMMMGDIRNFHPFLVMERSNPPQQHESCEESFYDGVPEKSHLPRNRLVANPCQGICLLERPNVSRPF